jgi:nitrogenase molybdenum-cofactor synthesis protein NifE
MRTGILMARKEIQKKVQGNTSELFTERSINEWNFNPHTPPYVGFRGALNLCARWFEEIQ